MVERIEQTEQPIVVPKEKVSPLKNVEQILESKIYSYDERSRTDWWGWAGTVVYPERSFEKVAADVVKVFQKYFPDSAVKKSSTSRFVIEHPTYGFGDVQLSDLRINEVLTLLESGLVRRLLIHRNAKNLDTFDDTFKLLSGSGSGLEEKYGTLRMYINVGKLERNKVLKNYSNLPYGPLTTELHISPSNEVTRPLFKRIYSELRALRNTILQYKNTEQFLDVGSLFENS